MEWHDAVDKIAPYVVSIETPAGRGTGFLVSRSSISPVCAVATAAHVVADAEYWEQPIRVRHHESGTSALLHHNERTILLKNENDTAVVLFDATAFPFPNEVLDLIEDGKIRKVGTEMGWVGFPAVAPGTLCFFKGTVSAHARDEETYLIDGVAINGVSGGPAFVPWIDDKVQLVGVVSAYIANRATGESLPGLSVVQDVTQFHEIARKIRTLDETAKQKAEQATSDSSQPPVLNEPMPSRSNPTLDRTKSSR